MPGFKILSTWMLPCGCISSPFTRCHLVSLVPCSCSLIIIIIIYYSWYTIRSNTNL